MRTGRGHFVWALGLILVAMAGCGPGRGDLSGKVTFRGKGLRGGSVSAVGGDGIPRSGFISDDGRYRVADLPAGPVKLAVTSPDPAKPPARPGKTGEPPAKASRDGWFPIPDKYADFATSGLSADIRSGTNSLDLNLE